jgi:hypothetical protein
MSVERALASEPNARLSGTRISSTTIANTASEKFSTRLLLGLNSFGSFEFTSRFL